MQTLQRTGVHELCQQLRRPTKPNMLSVSIPLASHLGHQAQQIQRTETCQNRRTTQQYLKGTKNVRADADDSHDWGVRRKTHITRYDKPRVAHKPRNNGNSSTDREYTTNYFATSHSIRNRDADGKYSRTFRLFCRTNMVTVIQLRTRQTSEPRCGWLPDGTC